MIHSPNTFARLLIGADAGFLKRGPTEVYTLTKRGSAGGVQFWGGEGSPDPCPLEPHLAKLYG